MHGPTYGTLPQPHPTIPDPTNQTLPAQNYAPRSWAHTLPNAGVRYSATTEHTQLIPHAALHDHAIPQPYTARPLLRKTDKTAPCPDMATLHNTTPAPDSAAIGHTPLYTVTPDFTKAPPYFPDPTLPKLCPPYRAEPVLHFAYPYPHYDALHYTHTSRTPSNTKPHRAHTEHHAANLTQQGQGGT